jgi:hypothetical protein
MPQIPSASHAAFVAWLGSHGIGASLRKVPAASLRATQEELSWEKATGMVTGLKAVLASSDGHVLDGHHHWAASALAGESIPVVSIGCGIRELLDLAREWEKAEKAAAT